MKNSTFRASWACGFLLLSFLLGCSDSGGIAASPTGAAGSAGLAAAAGASAGRSAWLGGTAGSVGGSAGTAGSGGALNTAGASELGGGGISGTGGGGIGGGEARGGAGGGGVGGGPIQLSDWQFYGRWDLTQSGRATTVNSGSHVTASFSGTGISAKFDTSGNTGNIPTVTIKIDNADVVEKEISPTLELASGLPTGMHDVTLFVRGMNEKDARWTPPLVASTVFLGFTVAGGSIVPTPRPKRLKMEFLGDSITEGVFMHAAGPAGQTTENWRTDGPRGYAALTAMKLGAEWRQVGFGSQGLSKGGNGGVPKGQDAFNWVYAGVARDTWQADVVVINQGTNDRGITGAAFAPLYLAFLTEIRTAYPDAKIIALRPFVGAFGAEIQAQVQARKSGGDSKVFYIDTAGWTVPADFSDGLHPTQAGSVKLMDLLVGALLPILN